MLTKLQKHELWLNLRLHHKVPRRLEKTVALLAPRCTLVSGTLLPGSVGTASGDINHRALAIPKPAF